MSDELKPGSRYHRLVLEEKLRTEGKLPPLPSRMERQKAETALRNEANARARKVRQTQYRGKIVHPTPKPSEVARARQLLQDLSGVNADIHDLPGRATRSNPSQEKEDWSWLKGLSERRAARKRLQERADSK